MVRDWMMRLGLVGAFALAGCGGGSSAEEQGETTEGCESANCVDPGSSSGEAGSSTSEGETSSSGGAPTSDEVPCDVANVLAQNCWSCHGDEPAFGAPMSLETITDFSVPTVTDPATDVAAMVRARINDTESPMPPDGSLTDVDKALLEDWIADGLRANDGPMCEIDEPEGPAVGPDELPCEPTAEFRAFGDNADEFAVPDIDDLYMCFTFESPFGMEEQGTAWAPIIDDERVIHHWLLLKTDSDDYEVGTARPCSGGVTLDTQMLMGWAPGNHNFVMPEEAGLELPAPGEKLVLQIHYNNTAGYEDALDNSGVALCTVEEPRENKASTLWLGTVEIEVPPGETVTTVGNCATATRLDEPVTMLLNWPHMHETGTAIKTELLRNANPDNTEVLVDVPQWNFENQIYYPQEPAIRVEPGDVLRTSCTFRNDGNQTVRFGEGTGDEMCFDFPIVYPIEAFNLPNSVGPPELGRYCIGGIQGGFP